MLPVLLVLRTFDEAVDHERIRDEHVEDGRRARAAQGCAIVGVNLSSNRYPRAASLDAHPRHHHRVITLQSLCNQPSLSYLKTTDLYHGRSKIPSSPPLLVHRKESAAAKPLTACKSE